MGKWIKIINPEVRDKDLLKDWLRNRYNHGSRAKFVERNGDLIIKIKERMLDTFNNVWFKKYPENSIVVDVEVFPPTVELGAGFTHTVNLVGMNHAIGSMLDEEPLDEYFKENYPELNYKKVILSEKLWPSRWSFNRGEVSTIFCYVFVFEFSSSEDELLFKLTYLQ